MGNYSGYRIQINGEVFPNNFISRGTYKSIPEIKRKISEFYDANGKKHERYYPHTGVEIHFKIRKRSMQEQEIIKSFLNDEESDVFDIVYWDDKALDYKTGDFRLAKVEYQHENSNGKTLRYKETDIVFERV